MSTVAEPGGGGGLKASITPVLTCWNTNAAAVPKLTTSFILFRPRFVPLIKTGVPGGPCVGLIVVMTARGVVTKVNFVLADVPLVPTGVVTVISTVPAVAGGVPTSKTPRAIGEKPADAPLPNGTVGALPRSVPPTKNPTPPSVPPVMGASPVTNGGAWN